MTPEEQQKQKTVLGFIIGAVGLVVVILGMIAGEISTLIVGGILMVICGLMRPSKKLETK